MGGLSGKGSVKGSQERKGNTTKREGIGREKWRR
jgi:hypothetical protein